MLHTVSSRSHEEICDCLTGVLGLIMTLGGKMAWRPAGVPGDAAGPPCANLSAAGAAFSAPWELDEVSGGDMT